MPGAQNKSQIFSVQARSASFWVKLCSEDGLFKVKRQKSFTKENQGGGKAATAKSPQLMRSTRPATAA